ncbi:hypothetical protein AK88_04408 [Plasmodium fragile]|uniref:Calponin-homology (CH) domain-containing protein n=1 Tax=Plasmodium fragile TaxID=5857 RepID=A0A0D9QG22_PLAFR|nr:uncharacterized protein AK88_04408 [Plasmodium fragile]KJP85933.1 hypothetical protein AK88_04408 [Plasmodium fragile]
MEEDNRIGKEQLVCWVQKMLKRKRFDFPDLKDGGVYVELFQCIWPQMMKKYHHENYTNGNKTKQKEKTNWTIINSVLNHLQIDSAFISYNHIYTEPHFSSCYQSLILLFFLHSLVKHHACDFVLAYPVTKKLTDFMSSEEPLNCLVRAGSVQLPRKICNGFSTDFPNAVQVNNAAVTNGEQKDNPFDMGRSQNCVSSRWTSELDHRDFTNRLHNLHSVNMKTSPLLSSNGLVTPFTNRDAMSSDKSFPCSSTGGNNCEQRNTTKGRVRTPLCDTADGVSRGVDYKGKANIIKGVHKKWMHETTDGEKRLNGEGINGEPVRSNALCSFNQMVPHPRSNFFKYFNKTEVRKSEILEEGPHDDRKKSAFPQGPHLNFLSPPNMRSSSSADCYEHIKAHVKKTQVDASCQADSDPFANFILNHDSMKNLKYTWNDEEKKINGESFICFLKTKINMYKRELCLKEQELELTKQIKKKEIEDVKMANSVQLAVVREKHQAQICYLKQQHLEDATRMRKQFEEKIYNLEEDLTLDLDVLHCQDKNSVISNLPDDQMEWSKLDQADRCIPNHGYAGWGEGHHEGGFTEGADVAVVDYEEKDANMNRFLFDQVDMGSVMRGGGCDTDHYTDDIPKKRKFLNFDYGLENGNVRQTPEGEPDGGNLAALTTNTSGEIPLVETHTSNNVQAAINKIKQLVNRRNVKHELNNEHIREEIATLRSEVEKFKCGRGRELDFVTNSAQVVSELLQTIDTEEEQQEEEEVPLIDCRDTMSYIEQEQSKIYEIIKKGHNDLLKNDQVVKILDASFIMRLLVRLVCALKLERVKRRLIAERVGMKGSSEGGRDGRGDTPSNEIGKLEHEMETEEHIKSVNRKNKRLQCLNEYYKKRLGHVEVWTHTLQDIKWKCNNNFKQNGRHTFTYRREETALHESAEILPSGDTSNEAAASEPLAYPHVAPESVSLHPVAPLPPFLCSPEFYLRSFEEENERDAQLMHLLKQIGRCENEEDAPLFQNNPPMRCEGGDNNEEQANGRQMNSDKPNLSACSTEASLKKKLTYNFWLILGDTYNYRNVIVEACHYICRSNSMMNKYFLTSEQKMREERRQFAHLCNDKDTVHMEEKYKWRQLIGAATLNRDIYKEKYLQLQKENEKERKNLLHLTNLCYEQESVKYKNTIHTFRQVDHNCRIYKAREKKWVQLAKMLITELTNSSKDNQEEVKNVWLEIVASQKKKRKKKKKKCMQGGDSNSERHIEECITNDACAGVDATTSHLTPIRQRKKEVANLVGKNKVRKGTLTNCERDNVGEKKRSSTTSRCVSDKLGSASRGERKSVHMDRSNNDMYRQQNSMCKQASPSVRAANRNIAERGEGGSKLNELNHSRDYFKGSGANYYAKNFQSFLNDVQRSCVLNLSSESEQDVSLSGEGTAESLHSGSDIGVDASASTVLQGDNSNASPGGEPWESCLKQMAEESCTMFQRILSMKEEEIMEKKKQMEFLQGELNEMKKQKNSQENKYACLKEQNNDLLKRLGSLNEIISNLNDQLYKINEEKMCSENKSLTKQHELHTLVRNYESVVKLIKAHVKNYPSVLCLIDTVTEHDKDNILDLLSAGENYNEGLSFSLQTDDNHVDVKAKQNCVLQSVAQEAATNNVSQVLANLEEANMSIRREDKSENIPDFCLTDLMRDMGWDN